MKRATIVFDDEGLYRAIKVEAARLDIPLKQVVSEALREWLQRRSRLSETERAQRHEALALAAQVRRQQHPETGGIEQDLAALREGGD